MIILIKYRIPVHRKQARLIYELMIEFFGAAGVWRGLHIVNRNGASDKTLVRPQLGWKIDVQVDRNGQLDCNDSTITDQVRIRQINNVEKQVEGAFFRLLDRATRDVAELLLESEIYVKGKRLDINRNYQELCAVRAKQSRGATPAATPVQAAFDAAVMGSASTSAERSSLPLESSGASTSLGQAENDFQSAASTVDDFQQPSGTEGAPSRICQVYAIDFRKMLLYTSCGNVQLSGSVLSGLEIPFQSVTTQVHEAVANSGNSRLVIEKQGVNQLAEGIGKFLRQFGR